MVADVVPHEVALEGECRKVDVPHDVPALHVRRLGAHHGKDLGDPERGDVPAQSAHIDVELLLEKFEQRGIDEIALVLRHADGIVLVPLGAADLRGRKHERGIALDAVAARIAQKSERKIEHLGARLFLRLAVAPHEAACDFRRRLAVRTRAQNALLLFEEDELPALTGKLAAERQHGLVRIFALQAHAALFEQQGIQLVRPRFIQVHGVFSAEIEQRVFGV